MAYTSREIRERVEELKRTKVFIAPSFVDKEQRECSLSEEWIDKLWCIHLRKYYWGIRNIKWDDFRETKWD